MIPIENRSIQKRLLNIVKTALSDNVKARVMQPDGSYKKAVPSTSPPIRSQQSLLKAASKASNESRAARRRKFEPHLPPSANQA